MVHALPPHRDLPAEEEALLYGGEGVEGGIAGGGVAPHVLPALERGAPARLPADPVPPPAVEVPMLVGGGDRFKSYKRGGEKGEIEGDR